MKKTREFKNSIAGKNIRDTSHRRMGNSTITLSHTVGDSYAYHHTPQSPDTALLTEISWLPQACEAPLWPCSHTETQTKENYGWIRKVGYWWINVSNEKKKRARKKPRTTTQLNWTVPPPPFWQPCHTCMMLISNEPHQPLWKHIRSMNKYLA